MSRDELLELLQTDQEVRDALLATVTKVEKERSERRTKEAFDYILDRVGYFRARDRLLGSDDQSSSGTQGGDS